MLTGETIAVEQVIRPLGCSINVTLGLKTAAREEEQIVPVVRSVRLESGSFLWYAVWPKVSVNWTATEKLLSLLGALPDLGTRRRNVPMMDERPDVATAGNCESRARQR